jgi:two-component system cell cycle sensor histidine kinase/response regulator CckA
MRNLFFSLRTRLLLLLLVVVIPGLSLAIFTLIENRDREIAEAQDSAYRLAHIIAVQEHDLIEATRELLISISQDTIIRSGKAVDCNILLRHLLGHFTHYSNLGVADTTGKVICSAVPLINEVNIADRSYYRTALKTGGFAVGAFQVERITGKPSMNLAYPIVDRNGRKRGICFATLDLKRLTEIEAQVGTLLPKGSTLTKIDRNGIILARYPDGQRELGQPAHVPPRVLEKITVEHGVSWGTDSLGKRLLYAYSQVESRLFPSGISVVLSIPEDSAFSEANQIFYRNLIIMSIAGILILLIGAIANEFYLVRGMNAILEATTHLAKGDLHARVEKVAGIAEIKNMEKSFNRMADELERRELERMAAEQALQESEKRFRQLTENIHEVFWLTDVGKNVMLYISPAYETIWGRTRVSLLASPRNWFDAIHPEDRERISEAAAVKQSIGTYDEEYRIVRLDGNIRWIRDRAFPVLNEKGEIYRIAGIAEDITERKQAEETNRSLENQLRQAQKLESLGTLASGIAHDFNNILGIILGHATLIGRLRLEPERLNKSLEAIEKAATRGASLVRQLLTFARKSDITLESVRVNDLINELVKLLGETFPKTIEIVTNLHPSIPSIVADPTQLHQVFLNLCINARDAMPQGGRLSLTTRRVSDESLRTQFPSGSAREYVEIDIADTGSGMDEATQKRIFEPFFTTKGLGKGTGLGLSTVFGIVQSHKGMIDVESVVGKGTTFRLFFPVEKRILESTESTMKPLAEIPGGGETILVVEDEEALRELLNVILTNKGYKVLIANDGAEAVDVYQRQGSEIKLVLTDMGLPILTGQELVKRLIKINPSVKIIIASGYLDPGSKSEALKAGVKAFVQKPYQPEEIVRTLRKVLDQSRTASESNFT